MKIVIVINSLIVGGAEKQAVIDANNLSLRGHDVTIAYQKGGIYENMLFPDVKRLSIKYKNELFAAFVLFNYVLRNKSDIIHTHMFWAHKVATLAAILTRRNIIFNEHGLGVWRKWYHTIIMRFISLFADRIINSCNATRMNRIKLDKISPDKLLTVYNSVDISSNLHFNKKTENGFTVGYIGRFDAVKRPHYFVEIAKLLKDRIHNLNFLMVGDGVEKVKIEKLIASNKLDDYFVLTGYVLSPLSYLYTMDVVFMPSKREGFSLALLETGACGIPTIAFDVGGNSEIINDQLTGFIIKDSNIQDVAERVLYLYENPEEKKKMGDKAKMYISDRFSVNKRIYRLEELYKEVVHDT
jgi:L-malate glycosyltransferase